MSHGVPPTVRFTGCALLLRSPGWTALGPGPQAWLGEESRLRVGRGQPLRAWVGRPGPYGEALWGRMLPPQPRLGPEDRALD